MFPLSTQHSESLRLTLQQFVADKTAEILLIRIKHQSINQSLIKTSYNILLKSGREIWVLKKTPPPRKKKQKEGNRYYELCKSFPRISISFSRFIQLVLFNCYLFPRFTQLFPRMDCNSFPRIPRFTQFVFSDCNSFPRFTQIVPSDLLVPPFTQLVLLDFTV